MDSHATLIRLRDYHSDIEEEDSFASILWNVHQRAVTKGYVQVGELYLTICCRSSLVPSKGLVIGHIPF